MGMWCGEKKFRYRGWEGVEIYRYRLWVNFNTAKCALEQGIIKIGGVAAKREMPIEERAKEEKAEVNLLEVCVTQVEQAEEKEDEYSDALDTTDGLPLIETENLDGDTSDNESDGSSSSSSYVTAFSEDGSVSETTPEPEKEEAAATDPFKVSVSGSFCLRLC